MKRAATNVAVFLAVFSAVYGWGLWQGHLEQTAPQATEAITEGVVSEWKVEGAGDSSYNGTYTEAGTCDGKAYYTHGTGASTRYLSWNLSTSAWYLGSGMTLVSSIYIGDGADLPANDWSVYNNNAPAPTVSEVGGQDDDVTRESYVSGLYGLTYTPTENVTLTALHVWARLQTDERGYGTVVTSAIYQGGSLVAAQNGGLTPSDLVTPGWYELGYHGREVSLSASTEYVLVVYVQYPAQVGYVADAGKTSSYDMHDEWGELRDWPDTMTFTDVGTDPLIEYDTLGFAVASDALGSYVVGPDAAAGGSAASGYAVAGMAEADGSYAVPGLHEAAASYAVRGLHEAAASYEARHTISEAAASYGPEAPPQSQVQATYGVELGFSSSAACSYSALTEFVSTAASAYSSLPHYESEAASAYCREGGGNTSVPVLLMLLRGKDP